MKTQKKRKPWWKKLLIVLLVLVLLTGGALGVLIYRANKYLTSADQKVFYNQNLFNQSHLEVGEVDINFKEHFPNPTIVAHNIILYDSVASKNGHPNPVTAKKVTLKLGLRKLQSKTLDIQKVKLEGLETHFYTDDSLDITPLTVFKKSEKKKDKKESDFKIDLDKFELILKDISLDFVNKVKKKDIQARADSFYTKLDLSEDTSASAFMDLKIGHLTFNTDKGGYLTNAHVTGPLQVKYANKELNILPTSLKINDIPYDTYCNLFFDKKSVSLLHITKKDAIVEEIRPLLTRKIQEGIAPFGADGPVQANANIEFYPGDKNPRAIIDLFMPNNALHVGDLVFDQGYLKARFINRLYDDYDQFFGEDKQNLRFILYDMKAKFHALDVNAHDGVIAFGPAVGTNIDIGGEFSGDAHLVSDFLKNTDYIFNDGFFKANLDIHGPANNTADIVRAISGRLLLNDIVLYYTPENIQIPIGDIDFIKNNNIAQFKVRTAIPGNDEELVIDGDASYINDLLLGDLNGKTKSTVKVESGNISWNGFLGLISPITSITKRSSAVNSTKPTAIDRVKSLKILLGSIYDNFHPVLDIDLDQFFYNQNIIIKNFNSNVRYINRGNLVFNDLSFDYDESKVFAELGLDISNPATTKFNVDLDLNNVNSQKILSNFANKETDTSLMAYLDYFPDELRFRMKLDGDLQNGKKIEPTALTGELEFLSTNLTPFEAYILFNTDKVLDSNRVIKTNILLKGEPKFVNPFIASSPFQFEEGNYELRFEYNNKIKELIDAIENTSLDFNIYNTYLRYKTSNARLPIQYFSLNTRNNEGLFDLMLYADTFNQRINIEGKVDNMTAVLDPSRSNTGVQSNLSLYSPHLSWSTFNYLFESIKEADSLDNSKDSMLAMSYTASLENYPEVIAPYLEDVELEAKQDTASLDSNKVDYQAMKTSVYSLFQTLKPSMELNIDTFDYNDALSVQNINADLFLGTDSLINLENGHFNFEDGVMQFDGSIDLTKFNYTPFFGHFKTKHIDLIRLLKDLKYLNIQALKDIDSLGGILDFNLNLFSNIDEVTQSINPDSSAGNLYFNLTKVGASGIPILNEIIKNKRLQRRFKSVFIDSLSNTITFDGDRIYVPMMEIQSNAFQAFVEGWVDSDPGRNIWVSFPLSNLKKHDSGKVPPHSGYAMAGPKIFLEIINQPDNKIKTKVHLSKRKYYKSLENGKTYKEYKKEMRAARKENKRKK